MLVKDNTLLVSPKVRYADSEFYLGRVQLYAQLNITTQTCLQPKAEQIVFKRVFRSSNKAVGI